MSEDSERRAVTVAELLSPEQLELYTMQANNAETYGVEYLGGKLRLVLEAYRALLRAGPAGQDQPQDEPGRKG